MGTDFVRTKGIVRNREVSVRRGSTVYLVLQTRNEFA